MPRKSKTPEVSLDAPAAVQPAPAWIETDKDKEYLDRGRNRDCYAAAKEFIEGGHRKIPAVGIVQVGAAILCMLSGLLTPHEHFVEEILGDFAEGNLTEESILEAVEEYRTGSREVANLVQTYRRNGGALPADEAAAKR